MAPPNVGRAAAAVHEDQIAIRQGLPKGARELRFLAFHCRRLSRGDPRCLTCLKTAECPRSLSMEMCLLGKCSIFGFCFLAGIWRNGFMMLWLLCIYRIEMAMLGILQDRCACSRARFALSSMPRDQAYQPLPKIQQKIAPKTFTVVYGARLLSTLCGPVLVANQPWVQITVQLWCVLMATFKGEPAGRFRWKVGWSKHTTNHQFLKTRVVPISYFQDCIAMVFFPNCATTNAKSHHLPCHHCCLLNLQLKPACFHIPLSSAFNCCLRMIVGRLCLERASCQQVSHHKRKKWKSNTWIHTTQA